jgi:hypothetical protein
MNLNKKIAIILKDLSGVNPLEDSRRNECVEIRSVLLNILRFNQKLKLREIKEFFLENNYPFCNASILYAIKNYDHYAKYNPNLKKWHDFTVDWIYRGKMPQNVKQKIALLQTKVQNLDEKYLNELLDHCDYIYYRENIDQQLINKLNKFTIFE